MDNVYHVRSIYFCFIAFIDYFAINVNNFNGFSVCSCYLYDSVGGGYFCSLIFNFINIFKLPLVNIFEVFPFIGFLVSI